MYISNTTTSFVIFRRVVYALLLRELKTRFGEYRLGILWVFIDPLIQIVFFITILGYVYKRVMPNVDYTVYVASGILTWSMFKSVLTRGMVSIDANRALFTFRQVKPLDAFVSRVFLEFLIYSIVYVGLMFILTYLEYKFVFLKPLEFIICYICAFLIGSGLSLIVISMSLSYKDISKVINIVLWGAYFISGVIFPIKLIPAEYRYWLSWNPMLHVMELMRETLFPAFTGSVGNLPYLYMSTIIILFLGLASYFITKNKILL